MTNRKCTRRVYQPHRGALAAAAMLLAPPGNSTAQAAPYVPDRTVEGPLNSIGDPALGPLMNALLQAFRKRQPAIVRGDRWEHDHDALAIGALMFEIADLAPISRDPLPSELSPYDHQFRGDMMKAPLLVQVGSVAGRPAYIAVNKRAGAPLPGKVFAFLLFALSDEGQGIVDAQAGLDRLPSARLGEERSKLQGDSVSLDPALPVYRASLRARGEIRSVGSDGMKTLMDRWERDFRKVQPDVRKGERWEHLGTMNGYHALLLNETDIAPMGRELWPAERSDLNEVLGRSGEIIEIRVARGGFNTPQRTTAQAIFVNSENPIAEISVAQLASIMSAQPSITRWGQLGLTGDWRDRPITVYTPPLVAPNTMSMQISVLGGRPWLSSLRQGSVAETAQSVARDRGGIGFGGFEDRGPGLKTLLVGTRDGGPPVAATPQSVASGEYPLTRYMYVRLISPGKGTIPRQIREFIRFVLSRQGQGAILDSGYFPLTAAEVGEELRKLR